MVAEIWASVMSSFVDQLVALTENKCDAYNQFLQQVLEYEAK